MTILILCIPGLLCALLAYQKGRNPIGWFFIGFFTHIIGLIIILVVSNKREEAEKFKQLENENRRLHEQLRQERLKNEQFRKHTQARLDYHDETLGIDTRSVNTAMLNAGELEQLDDIGDSAHPVYQMVYDSESQSPSVTMIDTDGKVISEQLPANDDYSHTNDHLTPPKAFADSGEFKSSDFTQGNVPEIQ